MASLGVHFALTPDEERRLLAARGDDAVQEIVKEEIEERWDEEWLCATDKAFDAIHRCLTNGTLVPDGSVLGKCILGGRSLHDGDEFLVRYLTAHEVKDVARALGDVDERWLRPRFAALASSDYEGPLDDDDFGYTLAHLTDLRDFFAAAADAGRAVVFTVTQ